MKPGPKSSPRGRTYLLLAAVILLWGANWPIMKIGLDYIPPFWFGAIRLFLGAGILIPILLVTGRLRRPRRPDLPVLISVGLFQMAIFIALVNLGLLYIEAGRSAVLAYTTPLWVTPAAVFLLGERLTRRKTLGLVCGLGGLAILFNPLGLNWSDRDVVLGNGLILLSALSWAVAIVHIRAHSWASSPLQLAPWQMLLAGVVLAGLAWRFEDPGDIRWSGELVAILAYNGLFATAFCMWASVTVTRALPAISSSLGFLGVPVSGVLIATAGLGEKLTATLVGGLVLVMTGMALVNLPKVAPTPGRTGGNS